MLRVLPLALLLLLQAPSTLAGSPTPLVVCIRDWINRRDFARVADAARLLSVVDANATDVVSVFAGVGPCPRPNLTWGLHTRHLPPHAAGEAINSLPGLTRFADKPGLHRLVRGSTVYTAAGAATQEEEEWTPESYLLPDDLVAWNVRVNAAPNDWWATKLPNTWSGRGVEILTSAEVAHFYHASGRPTNLIVQRYVDPALLLQNTYKFDTRWWVVVSSVDPLEAWILDDAYVKAASTRAFVGASQRDKCAHVTNNEAQKQCGAPLASLPVRIRDPAFPLSVAGGKHPWTHYYEEARRVMRAYLTALSFELLAARQACPHRCFQLLAADVIYAPAQRDDPPKALLLEVNANGYVGSGLMKIPHGLLRLKEVLEMGLGTFAPPGAESGDPQWRRLL